MDKMTRGKLRGSTLIEVIISMLIIMVIFSIAMGIYARITGSGISSTDHHMQQQIKRIIDSEIETDHAGDNVIIIDSIIYRSATVPYSEYSDLFAIEVKAELNGVVRASGREIFRKRIAEIKGE